MKEKREKQSGKNQTDMAIMNFLGAPHLRLNKDIINIFGIDIALWIADIFSRWNHFRKKNRLIDNYFFVTQEEIRKSTKLNFNKQSNIIKMLIEKGIIEVKKQGIPAKNWYKFNITNLCQQIEDLKGKSFEIKRTGSLKSKGLKENKNNSNKNNSNVISKDITYVPSEHEEQIISIIKFWNNLPNTTTHSNPDTKIYKTIFLKIENLLSGHPLICKNNNQPTKPFLDFINQNYLPESLWHKIWTEVEINNILQTINDDIPEGEKISLDQTLWNAFAKRRGGGFSLFLYTASQTIILKEYFELTKMLANIVGISLKKNQEIGWAQDFQQFAKKEEVSSKQIINLLSWYKNNKDDKYTPVIDSPQELQEKYIKLLRAKARQSGNPPDQEPQNLSPAGFPIITKSYDRKSKLRKTVKEWQTLLETNTNKLLNADIWKTNHTPNKITVFNNVISMQVWLDNVDFSLYGGSNLQNRIKPLHKLIYYYILCINDWWGDWMHGVKDNVFDVNDVNNKIFKMFIREMEDSFPVRIEIKSNGWINDSDWEPRN